MKPGAEPRFVSTSAVIGRKKDEYFAKPVTYADMAKGSFLPEPRLKVMDTDHIDAEVLYPGIMRYTERIANPEVRMASCQVYNEWIADFAKYRPALIIIDKVPGIKKCGGEDFDLLDYFSRQPGFTEEMADYEMLTTYDRYIIYKRRNG